MVGGDSMGPDLQLVEPNFGISFYKSYHGSSNFAQCRYFTIFKWPYFSSAWGYSQMVGHAGSPTHVLYVDVTLTRSRVKVKVTDLPKFRKSPHRPRLQPCDCDYR